PAELDARQPPDIHALPGLFQGPTLRSAFTEQAARRRAVSSVVHGGGKPRGLGSVIMPIYEGVQIIRVEAKPAVREGHSRLQRVTKGGAFRPGGGGNQAPPKRQMRGLFSP